MLRIVCAAAAAGLCVCACLHRLQDTVQTVQALKAANTQMKGAMKANKELDLNFIDNLQVGGMGGSSRGSSSRSSTSGVNSGSCWCC